jgi:foldase protein PrsA
MLLSACRVGAERYELTNYMGKSISSFERKSGAELTKQSNGVYLMEEVIQVLITEKDVSAITLLKNADKYSVFGVMIGMKKQEADQLLKDTFGAEIAKTINTDKNTITYSYLKKDKELYISYDLDQEMVAELSYYKVANTAPQEEVDEEPSNSGELMLVVGDTRVYYNEAMVYLKAAQDKYETDYGKDIWEADILDNGETFGNMIKREVINQITELKIIRAEAGKQEDEVTLAEEELAEAASYAKEHYEGLSQEDISRYLITQELLQQVYADNLLANKMFETLTINVDTEVPDEVAKQITVQDIVVYNTEFDAEGKQIALSEEEKAVAFEKIQNLLQQAKDTEDFNALAEANSEAETTEYTFGKGQAPKEYGDVFEETAFRLKTGEVSDIIATDYGWHILYCVSDYNDDATIQVKESIIDERRNEMFSELYSEWTKKYDVVVNDEAWNKITFTEE